MAAGRQKHKTPEEEEETREDHIMFADNFSSGINVRGEERQNMRPIIIKIIGTN